MVPSGTAVGKVFPIKPLGTNNFDVVRGTIASYTAEDRLLKFADVNEPRIDWLNGRGMLLVEGAAANLLTYSSEFDNASWLKFNLTITPNAAIDPEGTTKADKMVENTANDNRYIFRAGIPAGSTPVSVFARAGERRNVVLGNASDDEFAVFDVLNGVIVSVVGSTLSNATIELYGNNYYRCLVTVTVPDERTFGIGMADDAGNRYYLGDGTSGLFIYGAMVGEGSYIPTTNAAATRNADVITTTPPIGTANITTLFEDGSTNVITSIPSTFTVPNGRVQRIIMA